MENDSEKQPGTGTSNPLERIDAVIGWTATALHIATHAQVFLTCVYGALTRQREEMRKAQEKIEFNPGK